MNTSNTEMHLVLANRRLPATPLAGIDLNSGYMPVRRVFYYAGQPDVPRLQASLAQALAQWPDFAGTIAVLDGVLSLDRNDTGARLTVETRDEPVPAFGIEYPCGLPNPYCDEAISQTAGDGGPVFTVRITRFNNNHWILGTCNSHALCDGSGYWQFMQSWRDAFHGQALPMIDSSFMRYTPTAGNAAVAVPAHLVEPAVALLPKQMANFASYRTRQLLIRPSQLEPLKSAINAELAPRWVSTQDALMALLWQSLAKVALAHGATPEQDFPLANVINIRSRLKLEHYTGNMAFSIISHASTGAVATATLARLAMQLREDSQQVADEAIQQFLAFLQQKIDNGHYTAGGYLTGFSARIAEACVEGHGIMVNNWSRFPAYAMDFSGTPLWFDLATAIPMHFAMVMPAQDGIVLRLFLPKSELGEMISVLRAALTQEPA